MKQFTAVFSIAVIISAMLGYLIGFYAFSASVTMVMFATMLVFAVSVAVVMTWKEMMDETK
jgi:hypothetical protein